MRHFNVADPVGREDHYAVPPLDRVNPDEILSLIREGRYFVLHGPKLTGKTSTLLALRNLLNGGDAGEYRCAYVNVQSAWSARGDVALAMERIASEIAREARLTLGDEATAQAAREIDADAFPRDDALADLLATWSRAASEPLVLLIDEVDELMGAPMISFLRQLQAGYPNRPAAFPQSVVLCGVRDVRDHRNHTRSEEEAIAAGSVFDIEAKSIELPDFTRADVAALLGQHTKETGQEFAPRAIAAVWEQTRGQPWLVNALAKKTCFRAGKPRERCGPVEERDVFAAREELIQRGDFPVNRLHDKLLEPWVRRVIGPLLSGDDGHYSRRDFERVGDLGLVASGQALQVANPIYGEAIPRTLTRMLESEIQLEETDRFADATGALDMDALLAAFQEFFSEDAERLIARAHYEEAGPQLVLQAFLHRVVKGKGRLERSYAAGSRRVELAVVWPTGTESAQRFAVVCTKVEEGRALAPEIERGVERTAVRMDASGADAGHLVVFDLREGRSWADRTYRKRRAWNDVSITVWGA